MPVAPRDQLQDPHFRRAKPGCAPWKFFEQFQNAPSELRQDAQILVQQVEPWLRRRRAVGLPRETCDFEMIVRDADGRKFPFGKLRRKCDNEAGVDVAQNQICDCGGVRMRVQIVQQPNQHELRIRLRLKP